MRHHAFVSALTTLAIAGTAVAGNVDLPRYPSISPDGMAVAFSWHGDLWRVPADGGVAQRLTRHPGDDLRSTWSPDGKRIAFTSSREGGENIYVMSADGTDIRTVTETDRPCTLIAWGRDARGEEMLTFHATREGDVYRDSRPYRVDPAGGRITRIHDAFGSYPVPSPDGSVVAFDRGGYYDGWERRGYRGPESSDLWTWTPATGAFQRLTTFNGNDGKARWIDDDTLLFLSDREMDAVNLYRLDLRGGEAGATRLTSCVGIDVLDYDVSADGGIAVMQIWNTLYTLDLTRPGADTVALDITASADADGDYRLQSIDREVSEAAVNPDGKSIAVVAFGEIFVRSVEDDEPTRRVTHSAARDQDIAWSPDGLTLYYSTDEGGVERIRAATVTRTRGEVKEAFEAATAPPEAAAAEEAEAPAAAEPSPDEDDDPADDAGPPDADEDDDAKSEEPEDKAEKKKEDDPSARWADALTFDVQTLDLGDDPARHPSPSPGGRYLAWRGTRGDVHIRDLDSGAQRTLFDGWDAEVEWRWSPDGRYIAYAQSDLDFNRDIFIVPTDGSASAVNVTRHPDNDTNPRWSADGKVLAFVSDRVNDEQDIWLVFLDEELEAMTDLERDAYFEERGKAAKKRKPLKPRDASAETEEAEPEAKDEEAPEPLDLADAWLRVRRVTRLPGSEGNLEIHPSGATLYFTASGPESGLHSIQWNGRDTKSLGGSARVEGIDLDGGKLTLVSGSQAQRQPTGGGGRDTLGVSDRIRIEHAELAEQKLLEIARVLGEMFADPTLGGADWPDVTERYLALARTVRTGEAFNWVANHMLGELNGSHLGVRAAEWRSPVSESIGRLGVDGAWTDAGYRVDAVLPLGPAAMGSMALEPGDVITGIAFTGFAPGDTLDEHLRGRAGEETVVTIDRSGADGATTTLEVLLTPVSFFAQRQLRYDAWRLHNAELVRTWSDGRLGYIHIQGMSQPSLDVFERDLFAAADGRDGLIIDVRNNGGGWTADRLLSSIMVRPHAYTIPRGADPTATGHYPQDRLFIQRWTMPINMLCNEKSYSNAEIISHAFKTLGRGTLVGQQTHGSVISTGGWSLVDGTTVRLPFRAWYVQDGTNMELNGAMPDLVVEQTPESEVAGDDPQLRAAVEDLLKRQ